MVFEKYYSVWYSWTSEFLNMSQPNKIWVLYKMICDR